MWCSMCLYGILIQRVSCLNLDSQGFNLPIPNCRIIKNDIYHFVNGEWVYVLLFYVKFE